MCPLLLAMYYALIWHFWLQPYDPAVPVKHNRAGGRWIFYSWFFFSTIGLNMSRYGLAGAEAGMLMDRRWKAENAMQLMMHCDKVCSPLELFAFRETFLRVMSC